MWRTNRTALYLWGQIGTQWRVGFGGPTGLDWTAVLHIARLLHIEMTPHLWHKLHALERDALEEAHKTGREDNDGR